MKRMNHSAWMGFTNKISKAPMATPIKAPKIGMRAVKPMITEITPA